MAKSDPLAATHEAINQITKELAAMAARVGILKQELARQMDYCNEALTDTTLEINDSERLLLFTIQGPIPSVNTELKHYLPKDRYVWGTMKEWWRGQIASAIRLEGRCPTLSPACVLIQVGSGMDLDNIGIKTAIDALVKNHVIAGDKRGLLQFVHVEPSESPASQVRVCVFEPDDKIQAATEAFHRKLVVTKRVVPQTARSGDVDSFFGPPKT